MTTTVRSHDYYEDMADSIAIEKMTPSPSNREILRRLKENDPELVELSLIDSSYLGHTDCYCSDEDEAGDLGWLGHFIGKNTELKVLTICCAMTEVEGSMCKGMAGNQSLRKIELCGQDDSLILEMLVPFFKRKQSPLHLYMKNSSFSEDLGLSRLVVAMQCCGTWLMGLELYNTSISGDWFDEIFGALKAHNPQLEELRLGSMDIGLAECRKLSALISSSESCLLKLDLYYNMLDDECISILAAALKNTKHKLTHLNISGNPFSGDSTIARRGWESLASFLSDANCNLEELLVDYCQIDDESALILGNAVAANNKLKKIALSKGNSITSRGWIDFTAAIRDAHQMDELWLIDASSQDVYGISLAASSNLFHSAVDKNAFQLSLSDHSYGGLTCNKGADTILDCLNNDKLRVLKMGRNYLAEPKGWQNLPSMVKNKCPSLKQLRLPSCNIDDNGVDSLVKAVCNSRLNVLDLSSCLSVTSRGWKCIASLIENPDTQLVKLYLDDNDSISSEEVALYAKSLTRNDKLEKLSLNDTSADRLGCDYFSNALCDTSSINNTYLSNHTLNNFGGIASLNMDRLCALNNDSYGTNFGNEEGYCSDSDSSKGESYVRCCDKAAIAVVKIVNHHQQFDMSPLFEWDFKVLPIAVKWFDRAKSIEMEIEEHEYFELWFDENDHVDDDGSDESDVFQYTLPLRDDSADFVERVEKGKLNAIYQFVRGMPEDFVSLAFR